MSEAYRPSVPRKGLVAPAIVLAAVLGTLTMLGLEVVHLLLLGMVAFLIFSVVELFALSIAATALVHAPELRTVSNFAAVAIGACPFILLACFLIYERT
jgi:hypothetical protein